MLKGYMFLILPGNNFELYSVMIIVTILLTHVNVTMQNHKSLLECENFHIKLLFS